jgi:hypothetical protein
LQFFIDKLGGETAAVEPEFTLVGDHTIIGSTIWPDDSGGRTERYQVLTIRDGKIVDMQGCATKREAESFARRGTSKP